MVKHFPVEGSDQFIDRGLVYQNKLIYWFNHYLEAKYDGPRYEITDGDGTRRPLERSACLRASGLNLRTSPSAASRAAR